MEPTPKKRGRKNISAEELRRPHTISLHDRDYARLALYAKACNTTVSNYVLERAVYGRNPFNASPRLQVEVSNWQQFADYYPEEAATTHTLAHLRKHVMERGPQDGWFVSRGANSGIDFIFEFVAIDLNGSFIFEFTGSVS